MWGKKEETMGNSRHPTEREFPLSPIRMVAMPLGCSAGVHVNLCFTLISLALVILMLSFCHFKIINKSDGF